MQCTRNGARTCCKNAQKICGQFSTGRIFAICFRVAACDERQKKNEWNFSYVFSTCVPIRRERHCHLIEGINASRSLVFAVY